MNRSDKICALCAHYSVKEAPEGTPEGRGLCKGYEPDPIRREATVAFDAPGCVLLRKATSSMGDRMRYVEKMRGNV